MPSKKKSQPQPSNSPQILKKSGGMAPAKNSNSITVASVTVATTRSASSITSSPPVSPASSIPQEAVGANDGIDSPESPPAAAEPTVTMPVRQNHQEQPEEQQALVLSTQRDGDDFDFNVLIPSAPHNAYDNSNLDDITVRQMAEDINAYNHDLNFCRSQLAEDNLTPQEARTFQLRVLDLTHQIRHSQHKIETLRIQMRGRPLRVAYGSANRENGNLALRGANLAEGGSSLSKAAMGANATSKGDLALKQRTNASALATSTTPVNANGKRASASFDVADSSTSTKRVKKQYSKQSSPADFSPPPAETSFASNGYDNSTMNLDEGDGNTSLQRLGFWKCRLCESPKFLLAGPGRTPAAPCKWPLKDISKMITHFTEMHAEHQPAERCAELGAALHKNRGPFEYWLRRTRAQNVGDGSIIDDCIGELVNGDMPALLRRLSRAAAGMPLS